MQAVSFGTQAAYSQSTAAPSAPKAQKGAPKFGFEPITCCTVGCVAPIAIIGGVTAALFIIKGLIKKLAGGFRKSV